MFFFKIKKYWIVYSLYFLSFHKTLSSWNIFQNLGKYFFNIKNDLLIDLEDYKIQEVIGKDRIGFIFCATDKEGKEVSIKSLDSKIIKRSGEQSIYLQELSVTRFLHFSGIVELLGLRKLKKTISPKKKKIRIRSNIHQLKKKSNLIFQERSLLRI